MTNTSPEVRPESRPVDPEDTARIATLRAQLDALNRRLLETLEARGRIAREVMAIKQRIGLPRHDPAREEEMITELLRSANAIYPESALRDVFHAIFTASRRIGSTDTQAPARNRP